MKTAILTVGDIRSAIEGRDDDEIVYGQVVAKNGDTWLMPTVIAPVYKKDKGLVIDMRHPQLLELPNI